MDKLSSYFLQILAVFFYISHGNANKTIDTNRVKRTSSPCPANEPWYFEVTVGICCPCSPCSFYPVDTNKHVLDECMEYYQHAPHSQNNEPLCRVTSSSMCYYPEELSLATTTIAESHSTTFELSPSSVMTTRDIVASPSTPPLIHPPVIKDPPPPMHTNETVALLLTTPLSHLPVIIDLPSPVNTNKSVAGKPPLVHLPVIKDLPPPVDNDKTVVPLGKTLSPYRPVISEEPKSSLSDAHLTMVIVIACLALVIIGMTIVYCCCGRGLDRLKNFLKECKKKKRKSKKEPVESEESESFRMSSESDRDIFQGVVEQKENCIDEDSLVRSACLSPKEEEIVPHVKEPSFSKTTSSPRQQTEISFENSSADQSGPPSYEPEKSFPPAPPAAGDSLLKNRLNDASFCLYQSTIRGSLHINIHPPPAPPPSDVAPVPAPSSKPVVHQPLLQSGSPSKQVSIPVEETVPVRGTYLMRNDVPESLRRQGGTACTSTPSSTLPPETDASYSRQRINCSPFSLPRSPQEHESICYDQTKNLKLSDSESHVGSPHYDDIKLPRDTATNNRISEIMSQIRTRNYLESQTPTPMTPLVVDNLDSTGITRYPLSACYLPSENS